MATKQQVIDRAANDLGILQFGQTLQAPDNTRITAAYEEVYDELKEEGIAIWAPTAAVPDRLVQYMATLVADNCLNSYGVSEARFNRIKLAAGPEGETAKRAIRKQSVPHYESTEEPTDY